MIEGSAIAYLKDGTPYEVVPCAGPGSGCSREILREQIIHAVKNMSSRSLWQRFASPVHELTEAQLDHLTNLDGHDRVAWCAAVMKENQEVGIALARYIKLSDESDVAEFAVTVVDDYQEQGVGTYLLTRLMASASENGIRVLRGYVQPGNKPMLALCRHFNAVTEWEESSVRVDIDVSTCSQEESVN